MVRPPCAHNHSRRRSYKKLQKTPGKLKALTEKTRKPLRRRETHVMQLTIHSLAFVLHLFPLASAAATLSISPRKVRQINDPILQILHQLHKIIFITQVGERYSFACESMHNLIHIMSM